MPEISPSNKLIAKNTLLLYFRQFITMLVSLYTSRVVLNYLGVEDYGIYNVVGGIVVMFSFISATLGTASQRYIAYDLPKHDIERLKQTFSLILLSYAIVLIVVFVLAETIGVWFLNTHMNIPSERASASNIVLQTSIISFLISIITAPYVAVIIAHERMNVYAYVCVIDAVLKLMAVYFLPIIPYDGMVTYAILVSLCSISVSLSYRFYCKRHFPEVDCSFFYDKTRLKEIIYFSCWNTLGALSNVLRGQGVNILLNIFFNPIINAARAVSVQVGGAVGLLANNFFTASRSQIIMSYSKGDLKRMHSLIIKNSRFVILFMAMIIIPIVVNVDSVLLLWLANPPSYANIFVVLMLVCVLLEAPLGALLTGVQATGRMKEYNLSISMISLMNIPISYIFLYNGYPPESVIYVNIGLIVIAIIPRLYLSHIFYELPILNFLRSSILWGLFVALISWIIAFYANYLIQQSVPLSGAVRLLFSVIVTFAIVVMLGLNSKERRIAFDIIKQYASRYKKSN